MCIEPVGLDICIERESIDKKMHALPNYAMKFFKTSRYTIIKSEYILTISLWKYIE